MATERYTIVDQDQTNCGFVLLELPPQFNHTQPTIFESQASGDVALLFASLIGFTAFATLAAWQAGIPIWLGSTTGLVVTGVLAFVRSWRLGVESDAPGTNEGLTIKLETWENGNQVLFDEIQDQSISLDDWRGIAKAIITDGRNFSRPALRGVVSQTTYHKVKAEFTRLNFAHRKGNNYILSPRALAFLRKVESLPY